MNVDNFKPLKNFTHSSAELAKALYIATALLLLSFSALAYEAPFADTVPTIDGSAEDTAWESAKWSELSSLILGEATTAKDFSARYKVVWTHEKLYVLAEIEDDILLDTTAHPLEKYWEDDTFEVLIDEDASGGPHQTNYNAFAYHIALDNSAVDIGQDGKPRQLNDHIESVWKRSAEEPNKIIWEVSIIVFSDDYQDNSANNKSIKLNKGKEMGFMIAYCDADQPGKGRDNFFTSIDIEAVNGDKNRAYLDADVFDKLLLTD